MKINTAIRTSLSGLLAHKGRTLLTILGIVIGITSIILVLSIGQSAQALILDQIQGLGSKTIIVLPGREPEGPQDIAGMFIDSLKERDLDSLKNPGRVPYADNVMPISFGSSRLQYGNDTYQATVFGSGDKDKSGIFESLFDINTDQGTFFTPSDIRSQAKVAVIGGKVVEELFENITSPIGERLKINGQNFKIIGTLASAGQASLFDFDTSVFVPWTSAQQYVLGKKYFDRIVIQAQAEDLIDQTVADVEATLRENHNIDDPDKDDFYVETQKDIVERVGIITTILTLLLTSVAAISLVVGGVGIMNIMLVSVTERTKEIGLRKAIGATNRDILTQFLLDAVFLTVTGGVIGIILGVTFTWLAIQVAAALYSLTLPFFFPIMGAIVGILVSAAVGLIFGLYPAYNASKKSPIEALRYE